MPKRKAVVASDEEEDFEQARSQSKTDDEPVKQAQSRNKPKAKKVSEDESEEEERPISKKKKVETAPTKKKASGSSDRPKKGDIPAKGEENFVDLGKKRRATVSKFKGSPLLDIREYYEQDGQVKPGKKGISLSLEQWEILKQNVDTIDSLFEALK